MAAFDARLRSSARGESSEPLGAILDEMFAAGLAARASTYTFLLVARAREGDVAGALRLLAQLRAEGLAPDEHVLNTVLGACARGGDLRAALRLYSHLARAALHVPPPPCAAAAAARAEAPPFASPVLRSRCTEWHRQLARMLACSARI